MSGHRITPLTSGAMYTISKHAVTCMVECVRRELREKKSAIKTTVSLFVSLFVCFLFSVFNLPIDFG